ncbi:hypothetical protein T265_09527 [Opisthorchis viverrini]|uniref:Oxysterol-binding protein n=1 Tax=Opisthorchis viverrini TaxID=6198 RepID=A0A074Z5F0_OPIVI|nr:hypothetical protein T265_09527 [Opisthorchis viverrini]KER22356.1 hypothetical protein T265_09527 [Opisthorchis viverrini]
MVEFLEETLEADSGKCSASNPVAAILFPSEPLSNVSSFPHRLLTGHPPQIGLEATNHMESMICDSILSDKDLFKLIRQYGTKLSWMTRTTLPTTTPKSDFRIWSFVKQCIGKDLTKVSMPVSLNEPISFLQRIAEYMEYSELLTQAAQQTDPVRRMEYVCAFAVSATSSNCNRIGKPFNPLLGETYELQHNGFVFVAEQVSHHPPITAFHVESEHYRMWASIQFKLRFWGKSIEVQPKGTVTLELRKFGEIYTWQNPNLIVHNVLVGKMWIEHVGQLNVTNHKTGILAQLEFSSSSWLSGALHQVTGPLLVPKASAESPVVSRQFFGNWTRGLFTVDPTVWESREEKMRPISGRKQPAHYTRSKSFDPSQDGDMVQSSEFGFEIPLPEQRCLWRASPRPEHSGSYYNFTQFAIGLNELSPELRNAQFELPLSETNGLSRSPRSLLPPTDSRFRPDIRALELGDLEVAASEKERLEQKQRRVRKAAENSVKNPGSTATRGTSSNSFVRTVDGGLSLSAVSGSTFNVPIHDQPVVGPVWFTLGISEVTKQEDWLFTGSYWLRDWSRCPDLY